MKHFLGVLLLFFHCRSTVQRRPIYNIGHMVNSIKQVDEFLILGANAIEADVIFSPDGIALATFHGTPCDCLRYCLHQENIADYLEYTKNVTTPGHRSYKPAYTLLLLDLKTHTINKKWLNQAGKLFANLLYKHLFESGKGTSRLNVVIGVEKTSEKEFILGFVDETKAKKFNFKNQIGWQFSVNEEIRNIDKTWHEIRNVFNIWYSDGITNCIGHLRPLDRFMAILKFRDQCDIRKYPFCPSKVYQWTTDEKHAIRDILRMNVDGIITNYPNVLNEILRENEFSKKFRLANNGDDPWKKV